MTTSENKISNYKLAGMKKQDPERAIKVCRYYTKRNALRRRGHDFCLSKDEFYQLSISNCHYCGDSPKGTCYPTAKKGGRNSKMVYDHDRPSKFNGIDRVDSSKGYSFDNCVTCCKDCNYAKRSMSVDEFKKWIFRLYHHLFKEITSKS